LKNVLEKLNITTPICKICFKPIKTLDFGVLTHKKPLFCEKCRTSLNPKFYKFDVENYKAEAIYEYDENVKNFLYQIKGCFDIELSPIFLYDFWMILSIKYYGYFMVPIPSFKGDDEVRGFNHVEEIFKLLKLKMICCLKKTKHFKQAEQKSKTRKKVGSFIEIENGERLKNKKILIVDDVLTTGSSVKSAINLIKQYSPKDIKILVISRNKPEISLNVK